MQGQTHAALGSHLPQAGSLEAKLDEPGRANGWQFGWMMVVGQACGQQSDDLLSIPPCPLDDLVRRSVEVQTINIRSINDVSGWLAQRRNGNRFGRLFRQPHTRGEVGGDLRFWLTGE